MPETKQITFTHAEVAEALAEKAGLTEGLWGLIFEFGISGANVEPPGGPLTPAAIIPILKVGIQRFEEENALTIDMAQKKELRKKSKGSSSR